MDYQDLVKDFAERTEHNLEALRKFQKDGFEFYEVTQLINSCLGLLILPKENYVTNIPEIPLEQLKSDKWPIPEIEGNFEQVKDLRELIRYLRNAIAHFNIEFIADTNRNIEGIKVWNINRDEKITWKAKLSIKQLEMLLNKFSELIMKQGQIPS